MKKVLIANRGEIALRVIRACREMGLATVALYSDVDRSALHVLHADEAYRLGPAPATESYLRGDLILDIARRSGADAIHPGYGFLSENADFAETCEAARVTFIGPPASAMRALGSKTRARQAADAAQMPRVPGSVKGLASVDEAARVASEIGYPVMLKAAAGGGGKGMRAVTHPDDLPSAYTAAGSEAERSFGSGEVYLEKLIERPRHIEIQLIADKHGNCIYLGERECSVQRRHQKVIEEAPSAVVSEDLRRRMGEAAVRLALSAGYVNAGTVEFIFSEGDFYFLEVNARLQVEHPITEAVTGVDLVKEQIRVAAGLPLSFTQEEVTWRGHAIEMRINAEDPARQFAPNPRRISRWVAPSGPGVRVDSGFGPGSEVPPNYDSLVAKLIVHGADRAEAIARASRALREFVLVGPATTIPYHRAILESPDFRAGNLTTRFIDDHPELLEAARRFLGEVSPMDYGADTRRVAAAAAAVAALAAGRR